MDPNTLVRTLFVALVAASAFSGCLDADDPALDAESQTPAAPPWSQSVAGMEFSWFAGASAPGTGQSWQLFAENAARVHVPEATQWLNLTVQWTCGLAAVCDMQVSVQGPSESPRASGSSPVSFSIADPAPGEWSVLVEDAAVSMATEGSVEWSLWYRTPANHTVGASWH